MFQILNSTGPVFYNVERKVEQVENSTQLF